MGIFRYSVKETDYFGHEGYYGSLLIYEPKQRVVFSTNIGQTNPGFNERKRVETILEIMERG